VNIYPGAVRTPIWPEQQRRKYADQMLDPQETAEMLYQISLQPSSLMVEELTFRPQGGDISFH
jgi:NADP-dependent 3-hydroxy acid dehydrogenase YdfG